MVTVRIDEAQLQQMRQYAGDVDDVRLVRIALEFYVRNITYRLRLEDALGSAHREQSLTDAMEHHLDAQHKQSILDQVMAGDFQYSNYEIEAF